MAKKKTGILRPRRSRGSLYALLTGSTVLLLVLVALTTVNDTLAPVRKDLLGISVRKPYFVMQGHGLGHVVVVARSGRAERMLGDATLVSTDPWDTQQWQLPIPREPVTADVIIARAHARGQMVGEAELPYRGSGTLFDVLWNDHLSDDISSWRTEQIADAHVSLRLPPNVGIIRNGSPLSGTADLGLRVDIVDLDETAASGSMLAQRQSLARAESEALHARLFGPQGAAFPPSAQVITVDGYPAKSSVALGETCPELSRTLAFTHGGTVVRLTLSSPDLTDILTEERPAYFTTGDIRCGTAWRDDASKNLFYRELLDGRAPPEVQLWFDMYDKLLGGITLGS